MHIAVFGATGRTGRHIVTQALEAGHAVTAFVRSRDKLADQQDLSNERLAVVEGDVKNPDAVDRAVEGADAVLSALGHTSTSDTDVQTVGTRHIVEAMQAHSVERIISETGAGVSDPKDPPRSLGGRIMGGLLKFFAGDVLDDAEAHATVLRASDLDWTIVRAPRLTDGPHTGQYRTGYLDLGLSAQISRADVADFMLALATGDADYHQEAPMVTGA
jgi:putative NADH-flavin reductase